MKSVLLTLLFASQIMADSPEKTRVSVLREGTRIVDATATLSRENENKPLVITIERGDSKGTDAFIALPNQRLSEMETAIATDAQSVFRITGEIFAYEDQNYLLVRDAVLLQDHAERNHPTFIPIDPNAQQINKEDFDDSIADIVRDLEDATGPLMGSIRNAAENPLDSHRFKEGQRISMRRCHIVRNESGAWIAVFVSDATGLSDPPCTILPGIEFGNVTQWASTVGSSTPVLLSGELLNYHGHGFLMLHSWRNVHRTDHLDN